MSILDEIFRKYRCITGRHLWSDPEDALKCCDGYIAVREVVGDFRKQRGSLVTKSALVPVSQLRSMNEKSSTSENPWLNNDFM